MNGAACKNCRAKKVKCDRAFPVCNRCAITNGLVTCAYGPTQREAVAKLYKKEACFPCRRKKKRCDAVRPVCHNCRVARSNASICDYDVVSKDHKPSGKLRLRKIERALISRTSSQSSGGSMSSMTFVSIHRRPLKSHLYQINPSLSFSDIYSDSFQPNIIKNPPLSFDDVDDGFAFALSDVSLNDLNMKLYAAQLWYPLLLNNLTRSRATFIIQRFMYGVDFPPAKLQALLLGDMSSPILHNFFVHFANLAGAQFYQERCGSYCFLNIQARHLLKSEAALKTMVEEDNPLAFAQAHFYMGSAYAYARSIKRGKFHYKQAVEIVNRNGIRFVPVSTGDTAEYQLNTAPSAVEPLEDVHERVALLSQMVYLEIMTYILGQPSTIVGFVANGDYISELRTFYTDFFLQQNWPLDMDLDLEQQFRYELPDAYPNLVSPVVLRVQSEIFSKDASNLVTWFHQDSASEVASNSWLSTCCMFLAHLTDHISKLRMLTLASKDAESRLTFRFSSIVSCTAYARIAFVLAMSPSSSAGLANKFCDECRDALHHVIVTVEELEPDEFLTLAVFMGVTWSRALALFTGEEQKSRPFSPSPLPASTDQVPSSPSSGAPSVSQPTAAIVRESSTLPFKGHRDLAENIRRLSELRDEFVKARVLPGTTSLCAKLATEQRSMKQPVP